MLFALHEDGAFRIWDLQDRCRLLNFNLDKADVTGFTPRMMWVQEYGLRSGSQQIAFLFRSMSGTVKDTIHIYDLHFGHVDGGIRQVGITYQLKVPYSQGLVLDVKLLADSFWKLEDVGEGKFKLVCGSTKREETPRHCKLLGAEIEDQLFQQPDDVWEDLVLFRLSSITDMNAESVFPVSELFLSRILYPGVFQRHILRKVLENYNRKIPELDFLTLTKNGVSKEILAAIESENTGEDDLEHLCRWKAFYNDYAILWKQSNIPYRLLLDPSTGSVGLIRRKLLSVVRSLSDFEELYNGGGPATDICSTHNVNLEGYSSEADIYGLLVKCAKTISKHVGRLPLSTFSQALLGKNHVSLSHVSSLFLRLLDVGYDLSAFTIGTSHMGIDTARKKKLDYCQQQRRFELQVLLDLQRLRDIAGGWNRVLDIVEKYASAVLQDMKVSISRPSSTGGEYGIINKRLILTSAAQISSTHFEAARDLLLLLGYLVGLKGQIGVSSQEVTRIQRQVILQVRTELLISLLVHWLSVSFAEVAPPEDFSLHLSSLHIDSVSVERPENRRFGAGEVTLGEILMSAFKGIFPSPTGLMTSDALLFNSKAFISWLIWGDNAEQQSLLPSRFSSRSVTLSTTLLQHGQCSALQDFLNIVEDLCSQMQVEQTLQTPRGEWCARLHLMGCSLLAQARTSLKDASKEGQVAKASHCFFRVASAMGEDREALQMLLVQTGMQISFPVHGSPSAWKLQYFEWVMQIFEQNNVSEGACQFAYAALRVVDEAVESFDSVSPETSNTDIVASVIKGRLWANIFKFSLDLRLYKEAYCAIISNPDSESKYICLRRFLIVLCEHKATEVLCGSELPYGGMLEKVEQELVLKADYCDISATPNPYKLLYSFHMQRCNWRRAALYMYLYALRMKDTGLSKAHLPVTFALQEQLHGLVAAINALHLVDSAYAWIDTQSEMFGSLSYRSSAKRLRVYANTDVGQVAQKSRSKPIDLEELEKEYTIALAQLRLIESNVKLNLQGSDLSPADVLSLLVQSGLYEMAFSVLFRFWKDSALISELERMFRIMAERCCSSQLQNGVERTSTRRALESGKKLLLHSSSSSFELGGDYTMANSQSDVKITNDIVSGSTWHSLQEYLEKYVKTHSRLPAVVAETMLSIDWLMELPVWLVDMFKGGRHAGSEGMGGQEADPAALLRIYLDYGRISEATNFLLEYMNAWANLHPADVIKRKKMSAVWFPYTLVDRLKFQLKDYRDSDQYASLEKLLSASLQRHFYQLETDSNDVASLV